MYKEVLELIVNITENAAKCEQNKVKLSQVEEEKINMKTKYDNDSKITDHYAIIPTGQGLNALGSVTPTAKKVYEIEPNNEKVLKLKEEVKKLASLARLSFTEEEIEKYQTELSSIVEYCEKINEIDVSSVKPSATTSDMVNVLREDEVKESLTRQQVLENAKDKQYGCFYVTKVVE